MSTQTDSQAEGQSGGSIDKIKDAPTDIDVNSTENMAAEEKTAKIPGEKASPEQTDFAPAELLSDAVLSDLDSMRDVPVKAEAGSNLEATECSSFSEANSSTNEQKETKDLQDSTSEVSARTLR
eukprot:TRINITY_DN3905_c0_g1_i1.p1 TRINITY_DN3905_c0_g1~~TRINITY_DN3905_c0_g1_i1.p1  ORF type:complete len:124 (-),score=39.10 TRINITY_DN3905_c0_g1_i1:5-376(-)